MKKKGLNMEFLNFLDTIKLPFELPILLHPITVHFAISLPIIVLLLEITNLFIKRPYLNVISSTFLFLIILIFTAAFFAGKTDGSHVFSMLSTDGQEELKLHKKIGMYLVYFSFFVFLAKILSIFIKKDWMKGIFFLFLIGFIGLTLKQGKDGGELVYEYGANVEIVSKMDDKIMELEDQLDSCKSELEKIKSQSETKPLQESEEKPSIQTENIEKTQPQQTIEENKENQQNIKQEENIQQKEEQTQTNENNSTH